MPLQADQMAMESIMTLPGEVYLIILSHLRQSDLATIARCSKSQSQIISPILYKKLCIQLRSGDPDHSSTALLRTLSATPRLRYYVRQVEINNGSSTFWTAGHSKLLGILLSSILTSPERITSFVWRAGLLQTHIFFPELAALECTKILNKTDLLWVRWHLLYSHSLRVVRLSLSKRISQQAGHWFLSQLSLPNVRELSLQGADLWSLNIDVINSLESLELKLCHGLDYFLERAVSHGIPKSLKVLKIAGNVSLLSLESFLEAVTSKAQLETLSLRIGGVTGFLSTKTVQAFAPKLSTLVLDFRHSLSDPRSSIKYTIKDFQEIIKEFPLLKSVGVPLDLRNPKCMRYQRTKYVVSVCRGMFTGHCKLINHKNRKTTH